MAVWDDPNIMQQVTNQQVNPPSNIPGMSPKPELGLGILHTNWVTTDWAFRLALFMYKLPPFIPLFNRHSPYDVGREQIANIALDRGCKWVFYLDSDVIPPIDAVPWMIQWVKQFNKPVMSGLYWDKKPVSMTYGKPIPAAWLKVGEDIPNKVYKFAPLDMEKYKGAGSVVQVDVVGTGCLLIDTDVFRKLRESDPNKPFFEWGVGRKNLWQMSEDFYFCMRCVNELQIHPHVATAVRCDHECMVVKRASDGQYEMPMRY